MQYINIFYYKINKILFFIIIILFIVALFNICRFLNFLFFPNNNNEKSNKEILKYINYEINLQYISWSCYLIFFIILIYINITQTRNKMYKIVFTLLFILLIYLPIFPIINIINILLINCTNNPPFIKNINQDFIQNNLFEDNYKIIKKEFNYYNNNYKQYINCFRDNNPLLSNIDTVDIKNNYCWRTLYLKKTGHLVNNLQPYFPKTMELINDKNIHNAFFSILDPNVEIKPHVGYYKGYLRYHLGIIIPEENGKKPYLICGGKKYEWQEGKGVLFDDMFLHYVNNPTNKQRVVLYLDVKRKNLNPIMNIITECGALLIEKSIIMNLFIKNQHTQTNNSK